MENQHRQIKGYRELSQGEIDLMNEIKQQGVALGELVAKLRAGQGLDQRWISIGATDLQTGLMALRAALRSRRFSNRRGPAGGCVVRDTAAQCRRMGLKVGDTIEGRETYHAGSWHEARLTVLWIGEQVAVFKVKTRTDREPAWRNRGEEPDWTLDCRKWHILAPRDA